MICTDRDGLFDMQKKEKPARERIIYLHEINARPLRYLESVAVKLTHSVDYYALQILRCIGSVENSRVHALSKPFSNGPQFHLCILIISQTRAGIMKTEDAGADVLSRNLELRKHVPDYDTYLKRGAVLKRAICVVTLVGCQLLGDFKDQSIGLSSSSAIYPGKLCVRARMNGTSTLKRLTRRTIDEQHAVYAIKWWLAMIIRITSNDRTDFLNSLLFIIVKSSINPNDQSAQQRGLF